MCTTCSNGYYLKNNSCISKSSMSFCNTANHQGSTSNYCSVCQSWYYHKDGCHSYSNISGCSFPNHSGNNYCSLCSNNYYHKNGLCHNKSLIPGCSSTDKSGSTYCSTCSTGYYHKITDNNICHNKSDMNCSTAHHSGTNYCSICSSNYYKKDYTCHNKSEISQCSAVNHISEETYFIWYRLGSRTMVLHRGLHRLEQSTEQCCQGGCTETGADNPAQSQQYRLRQLYGRDGAAVHDKPHRRAG